VLDQSYDEKLRRGLKRFSPEKSISKIFINSSVATVFMAGLASEHDAAIELIVGGYRRLQEHEPDHELLQYVTDVTDQGFKQVPAKIDDFLDRFETQEDKQLAGVKIVKVLASYFVALRNAADGIEGVVRTPPQPVKTLSRPIFPVETLDGIRHDTYDDDEIPF
jgi:hypothetical protein